MKCMHTTHTQQQNKMKCSLSLLININHSATLDTAVAIFKLIDRN